MSILERRLFRALRDDDLASLTSQLSCSFSVNYRFSRFVAAADPFLRAGPPLISVAAFFRSVRCFKYLLTVDADLTLTDGLKRTVAAFGVAGGAFSILHLLDAYNVSFAGTLFTAAERGNFAVFMWIFATQLEDITARNNNRTTLLHAAAKTGNWRLINWLMTNLREFLELSDICEVACTLRERQFGAMDSDESPDEEEDNDDDDSW
jgi:hypothetical protein